MKRMIAMLLLLVMVFSIGTLTVAANPTDGENASELWITDKEPVTDYAYSFAVIGDTQIVTCDHPEKLSCIYDWLVENAEAKKMKFVFGLGDITDKSTLKEWTLAKKEIQKLDSVVPYSIIPGNHDALDRYISFFPYEEYADSVSGSFDGTMVNTYQKFNVGDIKYLVVNMNVYPGDDILEWAGNVIADHPDYNVIVTTHAYLNSDGNLYKVTMGDNDGEDIWEKLVKNHENIVLVLSGHIPTDNIVVTKREGIHGNIVTEMLVDPQGTDLKHGPTGLVAMLYFSEDGKNVQVEYYSTVRQAYFKENNQFSFDLSVIEPKNNMTAIILIAVSVLVVAVLVIVFRKKIFRKRAE